MRWWWGALLLSLPACIADTTDPAIDVVRPGNDDAAPTSEDGPLPELPPADGLSRYSEGLIGLGWAAPHPAPEDLSDLGELRTNGGGAGLIDLTGDQRLDLVLTSAFAPTAVFVNLGVDGWTPATDTGLPDAPAYCVSAADLDDDGERDLLLCLRSEVRVFRGLGGATFEDAGAIWSGAYLPAGLNLSDWDGDGEVDVHLSTQGVHPTGTRVLSGAEYVLRGLGDFEFEDVSERFGTAEQRAGQPFSATWVDVDQDAYLDLYVVKDRGDRLVPNSLYLNPGPAAPDGHWAEVASDYALDLAIAGMGVAAGDIDLDGSPEIVFTDVEAKLHVYSAQGGPAFDVSMLWGVQLDPEFQNTTWGVDLPDLDNDGDLDLVFAAGRREYGVHDMQADNGLWLFDSDQQRFEKYEDLLLDQPRARDDEAWRDLLVADVEGDGTLEILFTPHVGPASLQVTAPNSNHWFQVVLEGPPGNPAGLGAQVHITAAGRDRGQVVTAGGAGLASVVEPVAHFGLGGVDVVDSLKVIWPDRSETLIREPMVPDGRIVVAWGE